ncbi:uncharacterized protein SETTUDRAFT_27830 [Exserohilum turcica Et28A]|uniref:PARP-type domain-containing protein n=1 Tax=Exserohilum turcicum (strain 28A) TaxID=671987 RepID=R0KIM0_EXST2|nr:uncharacterized protein SETTUDRAFT_27830 [Exserohilum turcica Et28A]EOA87892.1 hypothetical protein SETTUDRAFT_27830 [Exserohilum turcica Et28A]
MEEDGPKWRLEHASTGLSVCQQAACKRSKALIAKGELRIGTRALFDNDIEMRYYIAWRHWACATKHQIQGLKETTENDPTKAPGYDALSPESQEQVRLAFEHGMPVDKQFKDIREDLAKDAPKYGQEYQNAMAYKVDLAARAAACRGKDCLSKQIKITKGELRLGILIPFDGEHASTVYKHWKCISAFDLANVTLFFERDSIEGVEELPEEVQAAVLETFQTGKIVEPPERAIEPPKAKAKKSRSKKSKASAKDGEVDVTVVRLAASLGSLFFYSSAP